MTKTNKQPANVSLSQSKIQTLKNGNTEILITIPWLVIQAEYQKTLNSLSKVSKVDGFRPGKAPAKIVESKLGKPKIYQEMAKTFFTHVYLEALKSHHLLPITNPKFELVTSEENKDWILKAITAQLPKVTLGDYKAKIKQELAPDKIWVPGKDPSPKKNQEAEKNQQLQKVIKALLENCEIKLPQLLIENEVNRSLAALIDQTARLGMTVEQYLSSSGRTIDQVRNEYQTKAQETIKLELILAKIGELEKITVPDKEIETLIETSLKSSQDKKQEQALKSPEQKAYLKQVLRKRKVIDFLLKL
ncbi:trigger factor [Patescibacteria group bacterium]